jgi:DNA-directed RNA polymerase specialized sigma24 family protein
LDDIKRLLEEHLPEGFTEKTPDMLDLFLEVLTPKELTAIVLWYLCGVGRECIARSLSIKPQSVRVYLSNARRKIRQTAGVRSGLARIFSVNQRDEG